MSLTLVQPDVVRKWDDLFAKGLSDKYPSLDLVRLEAWYFKGKTGHLLEYAFGAGINLIHMLEKGYTADAIDSSIEAKKALEKKLEMRPDIRNRVKLHHIKIDANQLPFADEVFDNVVCMSVLSLLGSKERVGWLLKELKRVMKPGAKMITDINGPRSDFARAGESRGEDVYIYRGFNGTEHPFHAYCPPTAEDFKAVVEKYFEIDDLGFSNHKYLHSEIQEFFICAHKA